MEILQKFAFYGCVGILIEFFFTSFYSLFIRHWKATGNSYLWMVFVYGLAGLTLEAISDAIRWPFYCKALIYLPFFYGIEAISGVVIMGITGLLQKWFGGSGGGVVPWEYHKSRWAPFGLINLKYAPAWLALALSFDYIASVLKRIVVFLATAPV